MEIRLLDEPALGDDALIAGLYAVAERSGRLGREALPFWSLTEFGASLRSPDSGERKEVVAAYDGERLVGFAELYVPLLDNLDKAYFELAVDPPARRQGVGTALVEEVTRRAREAERTLLLGDTKVPPGERQTHGYRKFADALGFEYSNVEVVRHLPLPVPAEKLQALADLAAEKGAGYELRILVDDIPAELVESLGLLMGQLGVDAPTGLVDFEEEAMTPERLRERSETVAAMGRSLFEAVALTPDGVVAAQSTLAIPRGEGSDVYQWGTFVHRDHRGHRLGLATKVANLQALQERFPGMARVTTQNAETNDYMVSINVTLGFEPVEESVEFLKRI